MIKDKIYHYSYDNITEQVLTLQTYETLTINKQGFGDHDIMHVGDHDIMHVGFQSPHCVFFVVVVVVQQFTTKQIGL